MAEMAARHVQAAFPRSRGGSASPSFRTALSGEEPGIGNVEVPPTCASLSDNWRVLDAIVDCAWDVKDQSLKRVKKEPVSFRKTADMHEGSKAGYRVSEPLRILKECSLFPGHKT
jgi:hypothetical protein